MPIMEARLPGMPTNAGQKATPLLPTSKRLSPNDADVEFGRGQPATCYVKQRRYFRADGGFPQLPASWQVAPAIRDHLAAGGAVLHHHRLSAAWKLMRSLRTSLEIFELANTHHKTRSQSPLALDDGDAGDKLHQ